MEAGTREVEQSVVQGAHARDALQSILAVVAETATQAQAIASAVTQMRTGSERVGTAIESIAAVSEQSAAGAEEVSASTEEQSAGVEEMTAGAQELAALANTLQDVVGRFLVEQDEPQGAIEPAMHALRAA
jgi:methyl-accepting chemotaxis protein